MGWWQNVKCKISCHDERIVSTGPVENGWTMNQHGNYWPTKVIKVESMCYRCKKQFVSWKPSWRVYSYCDECGFGQNIHATNCNKKK